jgi:chaperone LolA
MTRFQIRWSLFTLSSMVIVCGASRAFADSAAELLKKTVDRYGATTSAVFQFREEGGAAIKGTLTTKGSDNYRLELPGRSIVCDGQTVWNYAPATKSVTIDKYRKSSRTVSPEFFLTRIPRDAKATIAGNPGPNKALLVLEPPHADDWGQVRRLTLQITTGLVTIEQVKVEMNDGSVRTIKVLAQRINGTVSDALFVFAVPKGVETVDLR